MSFDPRIHDKSSEKIQKGTSIPETGEKIGEIPPVEKGLSSIEKSKTVKSEMIPPMGSPILSAPAHMESVAFAVATVDASGRPILDTVRSFILKGEEIKNEMLEAWMKNLREIEETVRQLLSSPLYQQLQEIRRKGDPRLGVVSGLETPAAANAAQQSQTVDYLATLDRLQAFEHVPATANVSGTFSERDASQVLVLPLTAALLAGGMVVGSEISNLATHPLGGILELIEKLQPLFPQVAIQDLVPLINLMIVGPIYCHSWKEAVNNIKNREGHSYVQTAQNFARDVIKIVADPNFIKGTLISRMRGTSQLSPEEQEGLAVMLKVVLIGVALSLLYSVEVGKVQEGKYGGIEPEELRDLLSGKWQEKSSQITERREHDELTLSLIQATRIQLDQLSAKDRENTLNLLLDYVTQRRELDPMLNPAKVFDETLSSMRFDQGDKSHSFKV